MKKIYKKSAKPGIEPGSTACEASVHTTTLSRHPLVVTMTCGIVRNSVLESNTTFEADMP